ncbi:Crp/Fnr family transcriptional regulator [Thalassoglobus sp.]|uniref:Crp/Fnr family transcriptional regulator n=1 Tax=Thalassoglobus sp. TaxID=2795869 RepID=UPI003AA89926
MQILPELSTPFVTECATLSSAKVRDLKSRKIIYLEKPAGKTYIVKRGYVRLAYTDPGGRLLTRMLLGKGAVFGDLPFRPRLFVTNERAITSGMTCIIEVSRNELEGHSLETPRFQSLLVQTLASQLTALDRRLQWQLLSPVRKRIATALYDLLCFTGGRCGHGHLIDIRLTHEEFAELVVAARPVVSEVLAELKSEEVIDYTRGHICLLSLDRLEAIAGAQH